MNINMIKYYEIESLCRNPKRYLVLICLGKLFYFTRNTLSVSNNSNLKSALEWQEENPPEVEFYVPEFVHDFLTCLRMHFLLSPESCTVKNCRNINCQFQPLNFLRGGLI